MRSEVIHKSPPDYCAGKSVAITSMGRFYVRTLTLRKIFPYKVTKFNVNTGNTLHVT